MNNMNTVNDIINYEKRRRGWIEKGYEYETEILHLMNGIKIALVALIPAHNDKPFIDNEEIKCVHTII
jgi:hypothetical protein